MTAPASETAVLVVGAGPAGLATALELARRDVPVLLVERRSALSPLPRATVVSTRTMELVRSWGVADAVAAGSVDVSWVGWTCRTLATAAAGGPWPTGYPTPEQAAAVSPAAPACVGQDHLEQVLMAALLGQRSAEVRMGCELIDLEQDTDGVTATLRERTGGTVSTLHARHLVGADGVRSTVRTRLGLALRGPEDLTRRALVLFRAPELWPLLDRCRHGIYAVTEPGAEGTFLPAGPGDRWLYGHPADPSSDRLVERIRAGAGTAGVHPRIERRDAFTFGAQIVDAYRAGRVLLAGDAAHRVSPRGGTGMNTAVHDGVDLGWRLAWVARGWAGDGLLDGYEAERRPVAEHNTTRSADPAGSVREVAQALPVDLGGRLPHLWVGPGTSTLDLVGPDLTLFTGPDGAAWRAAAAGCGRPPVAVRRLDALSAAALGVPGDGALLVRPDGRPAALWPSGVRAGADLPRAVADLLNVPARPPGSLPARPLHDRPLEEIA